MKRFTFLFFAPLFLWFQFAQSQAQTKPPGSGTSANPYRISTLEHLNWVSLTGLKSNANNEAHYVLTQDIDASNTSSYSYSGSAERGFYPLGRVRNDGFRGVFDGQGYTISNLYIKLDASSINTDNGTGFIKTLGNGGVLKNVTFTNATVIGGHSTGIALGNNYGTVENIHSSGEVRSATHSGNNFANLGGLVGRNYHKIVSSSSSAKVQCSNSRIHVGGLVGVNRPDAEIANSYSLGNVLANGERVGGLVGANLGSITSSFSYSKVSSEGDFVGGFVGRNLGSISSSFAGGDVSGRYEVGGFVGYVEGDSTPTEEITLCYALGSVSGRINVGGFVGGGSDSDNFNRISFSYAVGGDGVTGLMYVGGFAGRDAVKSAARNYYNTTKTGRTNSAFGRSLTNFQFRNLDNFQDWSPIFWASTERSYPYLKLLGYSFSPNVLTSKLRPVPGFMGEPMVLEYNLNLSDEGNEIEIPLGDFDVVIDWGDGSMFSAVANSGNRRISHQYNTTGTYTVRIVGAVRRFGFYKEREGTYLPAKGIKGLTAVNSFGALGIRYLSYAFAGGENLAKVPNTLPNDIYELIGTFMNAKTFNQSIDNWNVSLVQYMHDLFHGAEAFNQPLNKWTVSNVLTMDNMFKDAKVFNQPLDWWDVSKVHTMSNMFNGARAFNQPLDYWVTSQVTLMDGLFANTDAFNQNVSFWNFRNVHSAKGMFNNARAFNQPFRLNLRVFGHLGSLSQFFDDSGLSMRNYDAFLKYAASSNSVQELVTLGAKGIYYSSDAVEARNYLKNEKFWTFVGDIFSNNKPIATSKRVTVVEGQATEIKLTGSDADGHSLEFEVYSNPAYGSLSELNDNSVSYTASGDQFNDSFKVRAYDGFEYSDPVTISVSIIDQIFEDFKGSRGDNLGKSVSLSNDGSRIAIAAPLNDAGGGNRGQVRVYEKGITGWNKLGVNLNGEGNGDRFGNSVALSADGNVVAIGAYDPPGFGSIYGYVKVFKWNGNNWEQLGSRLESTESGTYGQSLALSSDGAVLAIGVGSAKRGYVNIFEWNGSEWDNNRASIQSGQDYDGTGESIALSADGSVLAVGAYKYSNGNRSNTGLVKVYKWRNGSWSLRGSPLYGNPRYNLGRGTPGYNLGKSLDLSYDGLRLVVGAIENANNSLYPKEGKVHVWDWNGSSWNAVGELSGTEIKENFGYAVAIARESKSRIIVGSNDGGESKKGLVRIFEHNGSSWNEIAEIGAVSGYNGDLGESVKMSGDGEVFATGDGSAKVSENSNSGMVKVYTWSDILPFAKDQSISVREQVSKTFVLNSGDLNSQDLSYELITEPNGSITINEDGTATYLSESETAISDFFEYRVITDSGISSVAKVTIEIDLNEEPVVSDESYFTMKDTPIEITLSGSDVEDDPITFELLSSPSYGSISSLSGNKFTYTPSDNAVFKDETIAFRAFDGIDYSEVKTITIRTGDLIGSILKGQKMIEGFGRSVELSENGRTLAVLSADGGVSVYKWMASGWTMLGEKLSGFTASPSISISSDGLTIAASSLAGQSKVFDWNGQKWQQRGDTFIELGREIKISPDGTTIAISEPFKPNSFSAENGYMSGYLRVFQWQTDKWVQLGEVLSGAKAYQNFGISIDFSEDGSLMAVGSAYTLRGTERALVTVYEWDGTAWNAKGSNIIGSQYKDQFGKSVALSVDGTILAVGAPFTDYDGKEKGSVMTYEWSGTDWAPLGSVKYGLANKDYFGTSVDLSDNGKKLIVGAPQYISSSLSNKTGYLHVYNWNETDWSLEGYYAGSGSRDMFGYNVAVSGNGQVFAVGAHGHNSSVLDVGMVSLFSFENIPPYAEPQSISVINGIQKDFVLNVGDLNGDRFGVGMISSQSHGNAGITAPESDPTKLIASYTANTTTETSDSFTYQLYDGNAYSAETTVSITINQANSAPSVSDLSDSVNQGNSVEIQLSGTDTDDDELTYEIVSEPNHGSAAISGSKVVYINSSDGETSDTFTYRSYDGALYSESGTVSISINVPVDLPSLSFGTSSIQIKELTEEIPFSSFGLSESGATYSVSGEDAFLVRLSDTGVQFKNPKRINRRFYSRDIVFTLNAALDGFKSVAQEFTISLEEAEDADGIPSVIEKLAQDTEKYNRDNNDRPDRLRSSVVHTPFGKKTLFDKAQTYASKVTSGVTPATEEIPSADEMSVIWVGDKSGVPLPDENAKITDLQLTALTDTEAITFGSDLMNFAVTSENDQELQDADETREGLQVRFYFEFGPETSLTGDTYFKKKSDGSYVPFMAESEGADGAVFTKDGDIITAIELTITDNSEWDDDPTVGVISDPGAIGSEVPDTTPPDAPSIDTLTADAITGSAEANSTVTVYTSEDRIVIVSGTADDSGIYAITFDESQPQGLSIGVTATDASGNESEMTTDEIPDTTAPTVSLSHNHDDLLVSNKDDTIRISAFFNEPMTDAPTIDFVLSNGTNISAASMTQGDASSEWFYVWDVPVESDGTATVTVQGNDISGNAYAGSENLVFTIDNTAPVLTANSGEDVVEKGGNWVDAGATADGDETVTSTGTVDTDKTGSYTITYSATDSAGNTGTTTREVTVVDTTAPTLTLTHNHADQLVRDADGTVVITAIFSEHISESAKIDIVLNNGTDVLDAIMTRGTSPAEWTYDWDVPSESNSTATLVVKASDLSGNAYSGSDQLLFTIDNLPPEKPSVAEATSARITGAAEAGSTVSVYLFPERSVIATGTADENGAYSISFDEAQSEGSTLGVTAKDAIGNESEMAFENVADVTPPTVVLSHDHPDTTVGKFDSSILLTATFNEAMTEAPTIDIVLSNGSDILGTSMQQGATLTTWTYTWTIPSDSEGSVTVSVSGSDVSGNVYAGSDTLEFTIDHTPPPSPPTANALSATVNELESVTITLSGTDADGDTLTYEVVDAPSYGTVSITGSEAIYTSTSDTATSDSFTYRAYDGSLYSAKAAVIITINPIEEVVNTAPTLEAVSRVELSELTEIGATVVTFSTSDIDGDALMVSLYDPSGLFELYEDEVLLAQALDYETATAHTIVIEVSDGELSTEQLVEVVVLDEVNQFTVKSIYIRVNGNALNMNQAKTSALDVLNKSTDSEAQIAFEIAGGTDQELFNLGPYGLLNFEDTPNSEEPKDGDQNNVYELQVKVINLEDGSPKIPFIANGSSILAPSGKALNWQFEVMLVDSNQDSDEDGIPDYSDNCYNTHNPDQADRDNDGVGDVCDDSDFDTLVDAIDACPDSSLGAEVDAAGCEVFRLPHNAFTLSVTDASCPGVANGMIGLAATDQAYTYTYTLDGGTEGTLDASNDYAVLLNERSAGIYNLCVEVNEVSGYQRCYTLEIKEPERIEVSSVFNEKTRQLNLDLKGSKAYRLTVNGVSYEVEDSNFAIPLPYGMNRIRVEGENECQGIVEEEIFISEEVKVYPNPSKGPFEVYVSGLDQEVEFQLNSLSGIHLKTWRVKVPARRIVSIDLSEMPSGMYLLKVSGEHVRKTTKIILE